MKKFNRKKAILKTVKEWLENSREEDVKFTIYWNRNKITPERVDSQNLKLNIKIY